jgi:2,3-bisphosphoglycerate-independent phosphoglycerate mutase
LNLANGDMVGHTGHLEATRLAVEAVDLCVGRLRAAVARAQGCLLVTADHGNADQMWQRDKKGNVLHDPRGPVPRTSHSLNPVPAWLFDAAGQRRLRAEATGSIARVGATVLELCGVQPGPDALPSLLDPA